MYALTRHAVAAVSLPLMVLAAACSGDAEAASGVRLTVADSGRTIALRPSDELIVRLDSNAATGFRWTLEREPLPDILALVGSRYVGAASDLLGAPGTEVWTFRAIGSGTTDLGLVYARSTGETGGESFSLTVEVAPTG